MPYNNAEKKKRSMPGLAGLRHPATIGKRSHAIDHVSYAPHSVATEKKRPVLLTQKEKGKRENPTCMLILDSGGKSALLVSGEMGDAFTGRWPRFGEGQSSSWPDNK